MRVSVIIPNFNRGNYLDLAIQSVLLQDYSELELIVIDGGSKDNSTETIKKYASQISYWLSESDSGQGNAINKGFAVSTGEIVTFLSSDDMYLPGTLTDVVKCFCTNPNIGAVIGAFQIQDENSKIISEPVKPLLPQSTPFDMTLLHPGQYRLHQVSTFYNRKALETVGFWVREDLCYVMDRELLYRVCRQYQIHLVDRVYGLFRKHPLSKSEHSILPFAEEFSSLYLQSMSGNPNEDSLRARHAKYLLASGWVRYAKAAQSRKPAVHALFQAIYLWPSFLFKYSYLSAWKQVTMDHFLRAEG